MDRKHIFQEFDHVYKIGESACKIVNIFFPKDCENNCPFCTTKEWYKDVNYEKWKESFNKVIKSKPDIIVITGGEPISDIKLLDSMLSEINFLPNMTKVYVNTSWLGNFDTLQHYAHVLNMNYNEGKLHGLNISRHSPSPILHFGYFKFPTRINCVLQNDAVSQAKALIDHLKNSDNTTLVLREDYSKITRDNLYDFTSDVLCYLTDNYELIEHQYCHFCSNFTFKMKENPLLIRYHRGTNTTSAKIGTLTEHMELILAPNGEIYTDWDKTKEGLEELL